MPLFFSLMFSPFSRFPFPAHLKMAASKFGCEFFTSVSRFSTSFKYSGPPQLSNCGA
jgi:hypothetical protein